METMQPTLKSGRNAWDRINMPVEEFHKRVKKIRQGMKDEGVEVLLLYGNGLNEYGNYCYFSNFVIRLPQGALVAIPREGELSLMFEGSSRGIPSVKKMTWIDDVRASGDISKECFQYLKEKNLVPSVIGFAGLLHLMPNHQLQFLIDSLVDCKITDSDHLLHVLRMVKSPLEILQIRRASRILVRILNFISETPFPVPNEGVFEAALRREARLEGGEDFRMMIAKPSKEKWAFRPPEDRSIGPEDKVIIYLAVEFERYWAEAIRTFTLKGSSLVEAPSDPIKNLYEKILNGMRPGEKISRFYKETMMEIEKARLDPIPDYGLGQGIGLSLKEFPMITEEDETILKEGMCFSLRLGTRDKEIGVTMMGNTIYLSDKGPEVFTPHTVKP